jgi:hypothetical protein
MSLMATDAAAVKTAESEDSAAAIKLINTRNVRRLPSSSGRLIADDAKETADNESFDQNRIGLQKKTAGISCLPACAIMAAATGDEAAAANKHLRCA